MASNEDRNSCILCKLETRPQADVKEGGVANGSSGAAFIANPTKSPYEYHKWKWHTNGEYASKTPKKIVIGGYAHTLLVPEWKEWVAKEGPTYELGLYWSCTLCRTDYTSKLTAVMKSAFPWQPALADAIQPIILGYCNLNELLSADVFDRCPPGAKLSTMEPMVAMPDVDEKTFLEENHRFGCETHVDHALEETELLLNAALGQITTYIQALNKNKENEHTAVALAYNSDTKKELKRKYTCRRAEIVGQIKKDDLLQMENQRKQFHAALDQYINLGERYKITSTSTDTSVSGPPK